MGGMDPTDNTGLSTWWYLGARALLHLPGQIRPQVKTIHWREISKRGAGVGFVHAGQRSECRVPADNVRVSKRG